MRKRINGRSARVHRDAAQQERLEDFELAGVGILELEYGHVPYRLIKLTTACAAIASLRPSASKPSFVRAFTFTWLVRISRMSAIRASILRLNRPSLGACAITLASMF